MSKKVIAFDLDGTLAPTKSSIPDHISDGLNRLLDNFQVLVISGGKFAQFEKQLLVNLNVEPARLERLHLMPTSGTRYYAYDIAATAWKEMYAENLTEGERKKIIAALNKGFDDLGYREKEIYGECAEDRGSQVTFSALGQEIVAMLGEEGVRRKEAWDPGDVKKRKLRDYIAPLIPEFEVRVGGASSIDVTKPGIDKAYGMRKLMEMLAVGKDEILFIGDRIYEGGNDYPVKAMGIDCLHVASWRETALVIETILHMAR